MAKTIKKGRRRIKKNIKIKHNPKKSQRLRFFLVKRREVISDFWNISEYNLRNMKYKNYIQRKISPFLLIVTIISIIAIIIFMSVKNTPLVNNKDILKPVIFDTIPSIFEEHQEKREATTANKDVEIEPNIPVSLNDYQAIKEQIISEFENRSPQEWGEKIKGVKTRIDTDQKIIALTFDACGGPRGSGYDKELIEYLKEYQIKATLFINARWIDANPEIFQELANDSLFEIEDHGTNHLPCSINGKSIYGVEGTKTVGEVIDEVEKNAIKIEKLTGRKPKYYRSGTAYYDEVCVEIVEELGYEVAGFSIIGDAGATFSSEQVKQATLEARPGSIIIYHMNQPTGETFEGLKKVIPELVKMNYIFVKLEDYKLY